MSYTFKVGDRVQRRPVFHDDLWLSKNPQPSIEFTVIAWRTLMPDDMQEIQLAAADGKLWYWEAHKFDLMQTFREEGSARSTDPDTSKAAAKVKRTPLRLRIWHVMCGGYYEPRPEGWTGKELAEYMEVPLNSITPRFAELAGKSASYKQPARIKDSGLRRDGQIVWVLV